MEKLSTIQKRDNLNEVLRDPERGPGEGFHRYVIRDTMDKVPLLEVEFQKGARKDPEARHGVLDEDLLEIVRDRLQAFQAGKFACRENACAITHIEEALMWLNKRKEDRAERGILGTYRK